MIAYNFVVSVNQHYLILKLSTPLLGLDELLFYKTTNSYGAFGSGSNSAQFSLMMLAFLTPLACSSVAKDKLRINAFHFVITAMLCVLNIVLATMRAAATETFMIVVFYSIMFTIFYRRSFKYSKYLYTFSFMLVLLVTTVGALVNFDNLITKFQRVTSVDTEGLETGKSINRGEIWAYGANLLSKDSYWIGYGHGVFQSNNLAWGGRLLPDGVHVEGGGHLHNLYLALPTLYGWTGSAAYMLLFLSTVWRLFKAVKKNSFTHPMVMACLGFLMSVVLFLIDEVKAGNAVQHINYPMIAWIWLGLANAAVRTLRFELMVAKTNRPSVSSVPVQTLIPKMKSV
ncbi:O-antigen ligase family protein [Candidatus Uhrbacteria bacterium]|nr:O-antigen ligase family protein [Candidatus Uhrbacteria bacterium]